MCSKRGTLLGKLHGLAKFVVIVGGFLILAGIVLMGISALAFFGFVDAGLILEKKYVFAFSLMIMGIGLLDSFSAVVISRWHD